MGLNFMDYLHKDMGEKLNIMLILFLLLKNINIEIILSEINIITHCNSLIYFNVLAGSLYKNHRRIEKLHFYVKATIANI